MGRPGFWVAAAVASAILSRAGLAPGATGGIAVGLALGALYVWLLVRRAMTLIDLPPRRALVAAQVAAALRLVLVFVGCAVATRIWPQAHLGWAAAALLVPVVAGMWVLARGG